MYTPCVFAAALCPGLFLRIFIEFYSWH